MSYGKRNPEHKPQEHKEQWESQPAVGDDVVEHLGDLVSIGVVALNKTLHEGSVDKTIFCVHYSILAIFLSVLLDALGLLVTYRDNLLAVR